MFRNADFAHFFANSAFAWVTLRTSALRGGHTNSLHTLTTSNGLFLFNLAGFAFLGLRVDSDEEVNSLEEQNYTSAEHFKGLRISMSG